RGGTRFDVGRRAHGAGAIPSGRGGRVREFAEPWKSVHGFEGGDGEDDQALEDENDLAADAGIGLHRRRSGAEKPEEQGGEDDADGMVAADEAHRDGRESEPGWRGAVAAMEAERFASASESGERARDAHGERDGETPVDATVSRRAFGK